MYTYIYVYIFIYVYVYIYSYTYMLFNITRHVVIYEMKHGNARIERDRLRRCQHPEHMLQSTRTCPFKRDLRTSKEPYKRDIFCYERDLIYY